MHRIFFSIYDLIYAIGLIFSLPFYGKRLFGKDGRFHDFLERLGIYCTEIKILKNHNIWIHAVSIGELLAIIPLINEISKKFSDRQIVVSCTSRTGRIIAEQKLSHHIIKIFLPFDFSFATRKAVFAIKPEIFISVETEIWPNLFFELKRKNIPVLVLNGRLSRKSFVRYRAFRLIMRNIMNMVDCFVMRSPSDAERLLKLGVPDEKVLVSKSIKFDHVYQLSLILNPENNSDRKIVIFGSIHKAEEPHVVHICKKILDRYKDVVIVIAPRALEKTSIYHILETEGIQYDVFSSSKHEKRVLVLDRYGVLTEFYKKCRVAFVGGSLVPAGGQNPIEPLAFKKPVIYGKFHWDFEQEWEMILRAGAGIEVGSFDQLYEKLVFLLDNPEICKEMGEKGFNVIVENKGATEQMLKVVEKFLSN
ncbi:MAG: hypothetical protein NC906_03450 [Candidatus Omnitrophica bacterium]|nr:hypothetical protein [Candidatus Omnitrophota bacterium]